MISTISVFALLLLLLACCADALTTVALIQRGGREWLSAWAIGPQPTPVKVWAWCVLLPLLVAALALTLMPWVHWLLYPLAAWRAWLAWRNTQLQRAPA